MVRRVQGTVVCGLGPGIGGRASKLSSCLSCGGCRDGGVFVGEKSSFMHFLSDECFSES